MRLLLVEDDARIARFVAKGLREQAYAVDIAGTGEEALYYAAINTYDVVVLDVMIPEPDGFAVCRELRNAESDADRARCGGRSDRRVRSWRG
jgi:two-component system copper resistance phosphate regulon response regulator CusR